MNAHGIVHKYGDNVDTDVIIPARYLNTASHAELAAHCMEDIDKDFVSKVKPGDIMVAKRTLAAALPVSMRRLRLRPVAFPALSPPRLRVFFTAMPSISACRFWSATRLRGRFRTGDEVEVDFDTGGISDRDHGKDLQGAAVPAVYSEHY